VTPGPDLQKLFDQRGRELIEIALPNKAWRSHWCVGRCMPDLGGEGPPLQGGGRRACCHRSPHGCGGVCSDRRGVQRDGPGVHGCAAFRLRFADCRNWDRGARFFLARCGSPARPRDLCLRRLAHRSPDHSEHGPTVRALRRSQRRSHYYMLVTGAIVPLRPLRESASPAF